MCVCVCMYTHTHTRISSSIRRVTDALIASLAKQPAAANLTSLRFDTQAKAFNPKLMEKLAKLKSLSAKEVKRSTVHTHTHTPTKNNTPDTDTHATRQEHHPKPPNEHFPQTLNDAREAAHTVFIIIIIIIIMLMEKLLKLKSLYAKEVNYIYIYIYTHTHTYLYTHIYIDAHLCVWDAVLGEGLVGHDRSHRVVAAGHLPIQTERKH